MKLPRYVVLLLGLALSQLAWGVSVTLELPNKLVAGATYHQGRPGKPAVLILHGFLQTKDFPTVHRISESLADEGYTVLAPTLSLGITHRRQSLACEAIHTHTIQDDGREVDAWLRWLRQRHQGPVVLLGHSLGSVVLLAYLDAHPGAAVAKFIGVSVVEGRLRGDETERQALLRDMRARIASRDRQPVSHGFSFCQKLTATPESYASYLEWSPGRILNGIRKLKRPPITFIMGSRDDRLGPDWTEQLRQTRARVQVIKGANHFMDGEHEFDLLELLLKELAD